MMILMKTLMKMNYWRKFVSCSWTMKKQELPDLVNLLVLGNKLFTIYNKSSVHFFELSNNRNSTIFNFKIM